MFKKELTPLQGGIVLMVLALIIGTIIAVAIFFLAPGAHGAENCSLSVGGYIEATSQGASTGEVFSITIVVYSASLATKGRIFFRDKEENDELKRKPYIVINPEGGNLKPATGKELVGRFLIISFDDGLCRGGKDQIVKIVRIYKIRPGDDPVEEDLSYLYLRPFKQSKQ